MTTAGRVRGGIRVLLAGATCAAAVGCEAGRTFLRMPPPPPPAQSLVLRGDCLEEVAAPEEHSAEADLVGARKLFAQGKYAEAERFFKRAADDKKNTTAAAEEGRFYEAECLRLQGHYPKAADTYNRMLTDFPAGAYREQALQHMFEIANYWLDDTREQIREAGEVNEGKRWFVTPRFFHWDKAKPFADEQGRALEKLEQVRYNDMTGPYADQALFLIGKVHFFNENYREADYHFGQLVEMHPNSSYAQQALELGLVAKQLSTGGPLYDGRKVAEARQMIDTALRNYPELVRDKRDFLDRQLVNVTLQQAAKDYETAEFYRRTGHPGSAYFCYETVRRRYPGTKYADLATDRMHDLRGKLEQEQGAAPAVPQQGPRPAPAGPEPTPPRPLPPLDR